MLLAVPLLTLPNLRVGHVDMYQYHDVASRTEREALPYRDFRFKYFPLAALVMLLPYLIARVHSGLQIESVRAGLLMMALAARLLAESSPALVRST